MGDARGGAPAKPHKSVHGPTRALPLLVTKCDFLPMEVLVVKKARRPGDGSKVAGSGATILSSELHHWWPQGMSKFWADAQGCASQLRHDSRLQRSPPGSFGAITNAHAIKMKGPWNGTIEPIFDFADSNLPRIVDSILSNLTKIGERVTSAEARNKSIRPYPMTTDDYKALAEGVAALVLRSPGFRNYIRGNTSSMRKDFGLPPISARDSLIAGQIHQWYSTAVQSFQQANMILLFSRAKEFILGEGYLNNVRGSSYTFALRAVVPLTPELVVICYSGSGLVPPSALCWANGTAEDVSAINELAQIYTREFLYFRSEKPDVSEHFEKNEFLRLADHRASVVEEIIEAARKTRSRP